MLVLRGVEKICRSELTLPARLGMQDKSNDATGRLSACLHIQDLELAGYPLSPAQLNASSKCCSHFSALASASRHHLSVFDGTSDTA